MIMGVADTWIGFDADDTLWHNEAYFVRSSDLFAEIVAPYLTDHEDPASVAHDLLIATERVNLPSFGYGIKGAAISMIETAITVSGGSVPAAELLRLVDRAKEMMAHPVELLPGAIETLDALAHHRLILLTKGDLKDQHRKIDESGLAERFDAVEILHEKDPSTYDAAMRRHAVTVDRFVMVGNSIRSDVLPVLELGAAAIHVPHGATWAIELAEEPTAHPRFRLCPDMVDVPIVAEELLGGSPKRRGGDR